MTENEQKNVAESNMNIGIYTIYDCVLKQYDVPFAINETKLNDYLTLVVNDVQSKYYNHEFDYIVNKIGNFNTTTGEIEQHFVERVAMLDTYIDIKKRQLQTIIQTLNYLPAGYYKMPQEMKENIQEDINAAVKDYVELFVVPDLDVQQKKEILCK